MHRQASVGCTKEGVPNSAAAASSHSVPTLPFLVAESDWQPPASPRTWRLWAGSMTPSSSLRQTRHFLTMSTWRGWAECKVGFLIHCLGPADALMPQQFLPLSTCPLLPFALQQKCTCSFLEMSTSWTLSQHAERGSCSCPHDHGNIMGRRCRRSWRASRSLPNLILPTLVLLAAGSICRSSCESFVSLGANCKWRRQSWQA